MPTYSYECRRCHKEVDLTRKVDERLGAFECPKCQGYNTGPVAPLLHPVHGRVWGGTPLFHPGGWRK